MITVKEKPELAAHFVVAMDAMWKLGRLKNHFEIMDGEDEILKILASDDDFFSVLVESVEPLQNAFGKDRVLQIRVQIHDDGDVMVKVAPQLPIAFADHAEPALDSFDEQWWLKNCHRSNGSLVFDYEFQDAI